MLSVFGVLTRCQNPEECNAVGSSLNSSVSKCPSCTSKLPGKYEDVHTTSGGEVLKGKQKIIATDDEDKVQPQKKKTNPRVLAEYDAEVDMDIGFI
jgi:hypothetical protein